MGRRRWYSCSLCSVYGRRLKTEGVCAASEICHPDVNQYFVGFVRASPNQPSVQPLLSVLSLPLPPLRVRVPVYPSLSFFRLRARSCRVCAPTGPGGICRTACASAVDVRPIDGTANTLEVINFVAKINQEEKNTY